ncbi:hypothetical protein M569_02210, partial [Genlisea aurea]
SPGFLTGFLPKKVSDPEGSAAVSSPTSILDAKNFVNLSNPFGYASKSPSNNKHEPPPPQPQQQQQEAIGLAIIDSIIDDESSSDGIHLAVSKPVTRMVLFGSKLKLHIPEAAAAAPGVDSPKSPAEFGTKTRSSCSSSLQSSQFMSPLSNTRNLMRQLSLKEMELSEDYTCVITHGPNPRTTHIFDECIVESSNAPSQSSDETKMMESSSSFLSFCHHCKDILRQDKDIYMYRGEKAFCSHECRSQEMMVLE